MLIKIIKESTAKLTDKKVRLACFALRLGRSPRQASLAGIAGVDGLLVVAAGVPVLAQTPDAPETALPVQSSCSGPSPAFAQLTYDEDNRYFSNPNCRTEFPDRLKFIPLRGGDENYHLSLGIFTRDRGEYFSHPDLGSAPSGNPN